MLLHTIYILASLCNLFRPRFIRYFFVAFVSCCAHLFGAFPYTNTLTKKNRPLTDTDTQSHRHTCTRVLITLNWFGLLLFYPRVTCFSLPCSESQRYCNWMVVIRYSIHIIFSWIWGFPESKTLWRFCCYYCLPYHIFIIYMQPLMDYMLCAFMVYFVVQEINSICTENREGKGER